MYFKVLLSLSVISGWYKVDSGELYALDGFVYYASYPDEVCWYEALEYCAYNQMHLIDIRTYFEQNRIVKIYHKIWNKYPESNKDVNLCWTSGTNAGHDDEFYWFTSGREVNSWTNWHSEYPKAGENNCIFGDIRDDLKWRNRNCNTTATFICRNYKGFPINPTMQNNVKSVDMRRRKSKRKMCKKKQ